MDTSIFFHLGSEDLAALIHGASHRVIFCAPGVHQSVAAALVNARNKLGRDAVRVILDLEDTTSRLGYGEFDAMTLLTEQGVDVRIESGLRTCVLICDQVGFTFFTPPMLVESLEERPLGINAVQLLAAQANVIAMALVPPQAAGSGSSVKSSEIPTTSKPTPQPEIGREVVTEKRLEQVKGSLEANPPQKFDIARKVNVFNAYIEYVELHLTGLQIAKHTVQLPQDLILALRDDATARRLLTTFRLVDTDSKVAKEAKLIEDRVRAVRERFMRSLGEAIGTVILRAQRESFERAVASIRLDIEKFQQRVAERLDKEIEASRKKLVEGLLPAAKKAPPKDLIAQMSAKPTAEVLRRYLDDELRRVFPTAQSLIREMKLEWISKAVTYESLNNPEFQRRVRNAFPYENWDKPFREFEAVPGSPSVQQPLFPDLVQ